MKKNSFIILGISLIMLLLGVMIISKTRANALGYVVIDINPSVEFITNHNDKVIKVNALNEDGEVLIAFENFIGMDISEACEKVVSLAIELGYLDVDAKESDPNAIMITTLHTNSRFKNQLRTKVYRNLDRYFMNNGVWAIILTDETLDEIVTEANELGISSGKLRLIKSIQTVDPSFSTEEGSKMSVKGLLSIVKDKKPFAVKVEALKNRRDEINALLLTIEDSEEIAALTEELNLINSELNQISLIKEKIAKDKQVLRQRVKERILEWKENHPNRYKRWQQLSDEEKQIIISRLYKNIYN